MHAREREVPLLIAEALHFGMRAGLDAWFAKAEGKAAIDYGFHMIITDLPDFVEKEMDVLVREGVTSFKLFMAYRGVLMLDDGSIFRALLRTGENGGTICMHAENGDVIDVLVRRSLAEGHTAPKWHALTRPPDASRLNRRSITGPTMSLMLHTGSSV